MKKVVILLPVYNEEANLEKFVKEVLNEEKSSKGWKYEILIVVDERSNDDTLEVAQNLSKKNQQTHYLLVGPGLGTALVMGHKYALKEFSPDALSQLDADGQVGADVITRMLKVIDEGYDLAIGSRFVPGGKNMLSPSRKFFTWGSSIFCRLVMGPIDIGEWSNSARTFTPKLFKNIDFSLIPWQEKTFIIQPSFINAAVAAGAKYKEVPLIFKNRAEGYSKMKVFNYSYDVIAYAIDARLHKWGFNIDLFRLSRRAKTFIKFGLVGITGTIVDFAFYNFFINFFSLRPATSKGLSTEIAIINNFMFNNIWTFRHRKVKKTIWQKLGIFNLISLGGLAIGVVIVKLLHTLYGDGFVSLLGLNIPYYNIYFFFTIPPVMIWNFTINHLITWKSQPED